MRHERYFFGQDIIFSSYILESCFPSKLVYRIFFLKSPINPSKVKCAVPKIHQTFAQLTDSDLSIISKAFWNNRGQNSLGKRGGILFYLPLPTESVRSYLRTYGDVITKLSWMDSLPNFLSWSFLLHCFLLLASLLEVPLLIYWVTICGPNNRGFCTIGELQT